MWPFGRHAAGEPLGRKGEKLARKLLRQKGLKILAANYRCPAGEADIIALDCSGGAETLAFVEVKTRSSNFYTDPHSAVDADKQRRLRKVAEYYLSSRDTGQMNVRFDVVSIVLREGERPKAEHIANAF